MSRFHFFAELKTWEEARDRCTALGMELASIHSEGEHQQVLDIVNKRAAWIGLTDDVSMGWKMDGRWSWSDGSPMDFIKWRNGEPAGGVDQNCGMYGPNHVGWSDYSCAAKMQFLCGVVEYDNWMSAIQATYRTYSKDIDKLDIVLITLLCVTNVLWCLWCCCICIQGRGGKKTKAGPAQTIYRRSASESAAPLRRAALGDSSSPGHTERERELHAEAER